MAATKFSKHETRTREEMESVGRANGRMKINRNARKVFRSIRGSQDCYLCGYNKHTQICHIKPICSFPLDALVSEINHIGNLVALCPNHHWELDNGHIELEYPIYYEEDPYDPNRDSE